MSPLEQPPLKGTDHRPRDDCRAAGHTGRSPQEALVPAVSTAMAMTAPTPRPPDGRLWDWRQTCRASMWEIYCCAKCVCVNT